MHHHQSDPVIDEVREIRHRISAECGHDPQRLVEYYVKLQQQFRERMMKPSAPTPPADKPAA